MRSKELSSVMWKGREELFLIHWLPIKILGSFKPGIKKRDVLVE